MSRTYAPIAAAAVSVMLTACGAEVYDRAAGLEISGRDAASEVAREYRRLARFEAEQMNDWASAEVFSEKALVAASGHLPAPTDPSRRGLDGVEKARITAAHRVLARLISAGADGIAPQATGQALARFDCWAEQGEEGFQPLHIGFCRDGFLYYASESERMVRAAGRPLGDEGAIARTFSITFPYGGTEPVSGMESRIATAARLAREGDDIRVLLGGHADRSGPEAFNVRLSEARARAVEKRLVAKGVPASRIAVVGFGESYPRVVTPDGERSADNRRVEIVIGRARKL